MEGGIFKVCVTSRVLFFELYSFENLIRTDFSFEIPMRAISEFIINNFTDNIGDNFIDSTTEGSTKFGQDTTTTSLPRSVVGTRPHHLNKFNQMINNNHPAAMITIQIIVVICAILIFMPLATCISKRKKAKRQK
ncbi:hypothetical protein GJ496_011770 [Pomphorhynchus laevis]|nr:hypothetical protein GJ496_011770 [Pomphorhynchus laevis]